MQKSQFKGSDQAQRCWFVDSKCGVCGSTSQFFGEAPEDSRGVPVFSRIQGVLSRRSRTQTQHVRQFLERVLEKKLQLISPKAREVTVVSKQAKRGTRTTITVPFAVTRSSNPGGERHNGTQRQWNQGDRHRFVIRRQEQVELSHCTDGQ